MLLYQAQDDDQHSFVKKRQHGAYDVKCIRSVSFQKIPVVWGNYPMNDGQMEICTSQYVKNSCIYPMFTNRRPNYRWDCKSCTSPMLLFFFPKNLLFENLTIKIIQTTLREYNATPPSLMTTAGLGESIVHRNNHAPSPIRINKNKSINTTSFNLAIGVW